MEKWEKNQNLWAFSVTPRFLVRPYWRIRIEFGARDHILGLLFALSDVGMSKSYNCINISYTKLQNKTTTVVVFTVSYTYSSESHLHIQNYTLYLHDQSAEPTVMNPYSCVGPAECGRSLFSSSVPTRIENQC